MKKPLGTAMISCRRITGQPKGTLIDQTGHRTSMRISLCRSTLRRMFAMVSMIMNTNVPTIMPCDHASSVKCAGSEGFAGRGFSMMAEATPLV